MRNKSKEIRKVISSFVPCNTCRMMRLFKFVLQLIWSTHKSEILCILFLHVGNRNSDSEEEPPPKKQKPEHQMNTSMAGMHPGMMPPNAMPPQYGPPMIGPMGPVGPPFMGAG